MTRILRVGSRKVALQSRAVEICCICAEYSLRLEPLWVPRAREENVNADKLIEVDDWASGSKSVLEAAVYGIKWAHDMAGLESPTNHIPWCRQYLRAHTVK